MPTLQQLQANSRRANDALRSALDRLDQARDRARNAIHHVALLEARAIGDDVSDEDLTAARTERDEALADLKTVEAELQP
jgi:uncharacterized protein YnzC (UPF0291/DUF896 family)